jgi:FMN reductase
MIAPAASIAILSGSPFPCSRTHRLATRVAARLAQDGFDLRVIELRSLPADALLHARVDDLELRGAVEAVDRAQGVVVVTPIHHTSCSGLLKVFLDLLPQGGLAGKVVLPIGVGGSPAHVLAIDYALRPILVALGALHVTAGHVLLPPLDGAPRMTTTAGHPDGETAARLDDAVRAFAWSLRLHSSVDFAGPSPAPDGNGKSVTELRSRDSSSRQRISGSARPSAALGT